MPKLSLAAVPRELGLLQDPTVLAAGDAVYLTLAVFAQKDPADTAEFQVCLATKSAQQLAADLAKALKKMT